MAPDGLFSHFYGPRVGRRNDNRLLRASGLARLIHKRNLYQQQRRVNRQYRIGLDSGYGFNHRGFLRARSYFGNPAQRRTFRLMSRMRVSVEWGFGRIQNLWNYCAHSSQLRSLQTQPGKCYSVAALLTNIHTCLYQSSQVSTYFNCQPPRVYDYLNVAPPTNQDLASYQPLVNANANIR